jgi:hypothetical protein
VCVVPTSTTETLELSVRKIDTTPTPGCLIAYRSCKSPLIVIALRAEPRRGRLIRLDSHKSPLFCAGGLRANSRTMSHGSAAPSWRVLRSARRRLTGHPRPARVSTQPIGNQVRRQHYRYVRGTSQYRRLEGVLPRHALLMKIHKPPKASNHGDPHHSCVDDLF